MESEWTATSQPEAYTRSSMVSGKNWLSAVVFCDTSMYAHSILLLLVKPARRLRQVVAMASQPKAYLSLPVLWYINVRSFHSAFACQDGQTLAQVVAMASQPGAYLSLPALWHINVRSFHSAFKLGTVKPARGLRQVVAMTRRPKAYLYHCPFYDSPICTLIQFCF